MPTYYKDQPPSQALIDQLTAQGIPINYIDRPPQVAQEPAYPDYNYYAPKPIDPGTAWMTGGTTPEIQAQLQAVAAAKQQWAQDAALYDQQYYGASSVRPDLLPYLPEGWSPNGSYTPRYDQTQPSPLSTVPGYTAPGTMDPTAQSIQNYWLAQGSGNPAQAAFYQTQYQQNAAAQQQAIQQWLQSQAGQPWGAAPYNPGGTGSGTTGTGAGAGSGTGGTGTTGTGTGTGGTGGTGTGGTVFPGYNPTVTTPTDLGVQPFNPVTLPAGQGSGNASNADLFGTATGVGTGAVANASASDSALSSLFPGIGYLQGVAQTGNPIDQTPAWQAMVDAQQRNLDRNYANMTEAFGVSGNRFSTAFGNAATDYWTQTGKDQNALLLQAQAQAMEAAKGRQLSASSQLGQMGFQGASQLSSQDFQDYMAQRQQSFQAASQLAGGADTALGQLGGYGAQGSNALLQNAMTGIQGLFGAENTAAGQLFGGETNAMQQYANYDNMIRQLSLSAAGTAGGLEQGNLSLGNQIAQGQYGTLEDQINRVYQEYMRMLPVNNPLMGYMFSGATGFTPQQSYVTPGFWDYFSSTLGAIGGAAAGGLASKSDVRIKRNVSNFNKQIKDLDKIRSVTYKYVGSDIEHTGVLAQEVQQVCPEAVVEYAGGVLGVDYGLLAAFALNEIRRLKEEK